MTFATPLGKEPQPDPNSETLIAFAGNYLESSQEKLMEMVMRGEIVKVEETLLREADADIQPGLGGIPGAISVDREVVSGGNPLAANALGDEFLDMMRA